MDHKKKWIDLFAKERQDSTLSLSGSQDRDVGGGADRLEGGEAQLTDLLLFQSRTQSSLKLGCLEPIRGDRATTVTEADLISVPASFGPLTSDPCRAPGVEGLSRVPAAKLMICGTRPHRMEVINLRSVKSNTLLDSF